jgi:solute carrier family 13 (sodium-dependent dicarboxylate transporter), member 2/3/5
MERRRGLALGAALIAGAGILMIPAPVALSPAGQRTLAVLAMAVILWITEAVSFATSAVLVTTALAVAVGLGPKSADVGSPAYGTGKALALALGGFTTPAVVLVGGALFLSAAMRVTGLERRLALLLLSRIGTSRERLLLGVIFTCAALAFVVPSTTARAAAMVPIVAGLVAACGLPPTSQLAAQLMITVAHASSIWNVAVKTGAAQNLVAVGLFEKTLGVTLTWGAWLREGLPWAVLMTGALIVTMRWLVPAEAVDEAQAGAAIARDRQHLGVMRGPERRLAMLSAVLLAAWITEGWLHPVDSATAMLVALGVMLLPRVGVLAWDEAERLVPWGTLLLFGVGVGLGSALVDTGAARWVADTTLSRLGVATLSPLAMIAVLGVVNLAVHQGFASAAGLASALLPVFLAFFTALDRPDAPALGMTLVQQFLVSVGFLLPVNSPQNMVAYGSGAFTTRAFLRTGVPLTVAALGVTLLLAATYWRWTGLLP